MRVQHSAPLSKTLALALAAGLLLAATQAWAGCVPSKANGFYCPPPPPPPPPPPRPAPAPAPVIQPHPASVPVPTPTPMPVQTPHPQPTPSRPNEPAVAPSPGQTHPAGVVTGGNAAMAPREAPVGSAGAIRRDPLPPPPPPLPNPFKNPPTPSAGPVEAVRPAAANPFAHAGLPASEAGAAGKTANPFATPSERTGAAVGRSNPFGGGSGSENKGSERSAGPTGNPFAEAAAKEKPAAAGGNPFAEKVKPAIPPPTPAALRQPGETAHAPAPAAATAARGETLGGGPAAGPPAARMVGNVTVRREGSGQIVSVERPGLAARDIHTDGRARHIEVTQPNGGKMLVDRALYAQRRVETRLPEGVRVVSTGRAGYVERPVAKGAVARTAVQGERLVTRVYVPVPYQGVVYYGLVPPFYFNPAFYGWVIDSWGDPVPYGWGPAAWYGRWPDYFVAERAYPNAPLWLTDYILRQEMEQAYQEQEDAAEAMAPPMADAADGGGLTPEVKYLIAAEVRQQVQAQQAMAGQYGATLPDPPTQDRRPAALDPTFRLFIVNTGFNMTGADGKSCLLTPGDVISRGSTAAVDGKVPVTVVSAKAGDCSPGATATVDVTLLQEMYNQFGERVADGMSALAANGGKGGLPASPPPNRQLLPAGQASAGADTKTLLTQQQLDADRADEEIRLASGG